jgi:hypothetical protein
MCQEEWWTLYQDAVLETDRDQLGTRIRAAQQAIAARESFGEQLPADERIALSNASAALIILQQEHRR